MAFMSLGIISCRPAPQGAPLLLRRAARSPKVALDSVQGEDGHKAFKPCCCNEDLEDMAHIPLPKAKYVITRKGSTASNDLKLNALKLHASCLSA